MAGAADKATDVLLLVVGSVAGDIEDRREEPEVGREELELDDGCEELADGCEEPADLRDSV